MKTRFLDSLTPAVIVALSGLDMSREVRTQRYQLKKALPNPAKRAKIKAARKQRKATKK